MGADHVLLVLGLSTVSLFGVADCVPFAILRKIENNDAKEVPVQIGHVDQKDVAFFLHTPQVSRNVEARLIGIQPRFDDLASGTKRNVVPNVRTQMLGNVDRNIGAFIQNPEFSQVYVPVRVNGIRGVPSDPKVNLLERVLVPHRRISEPLPDVHYSKNDNFQDRSNPSTIGQKPSIIVIRQPDIVSRKSVVLDDSSRSLFQRRVSSIPDIQGIFHSLPTEKVSHDVRDVLIRPPFPGIMLGDNQHSLKLKARSPLIFMNGAFEISPSGGSGYAGGGSGESKSSGGD